MKNKSKRKRNFMYHFLAKSKPHERIDLFITADVNIYHTKKNSSSNENMLLSRKTNETIWKSPISEQFFHDPPLCPNFKNKIPPPPNFKGGRKL